MEAFTNCVRRVVHSRQPRKAADPPPCSRRPKGTTPSTARMFLKKVGDAVKTVKPSFPRALPRSEGGKQGWAPGERPSKTVKRKRSTRSLSDDITEILNAIPPQDPSLEPSERADEPSLRRQKVNNLRRSRLQRMKLQITPTTRTRLIPAALSSGASTRVERLRAKLTSTTRRTRLRPLAVVSPFSRKSNRDTSMQVDGLPQALEISPTVPSIPDDNVDDVIASLTVAMRGLSIGLEVDFAKHGLAVNAPSYTASTAMDQVAFEDLLGTVVSKLESWAISHSEEWPINVHVVDSQSGTTFLTLPSTTAAAYNLPYSPSATTESAITEDVTMNAVDIVHKTLDDVPMRDASASTKDKRRADMRKRAFKTLKHLGSSTGPLPFKKGTAPAQDSPGSRRASNSGRAFRHALTKSTALAGASWRGMRNLGIVSSSSPPTDLNSSEQPLPA